MKYKLLSFSASENLAKLHRNLYLFFIRTRALVIVKRLLVFISDTVIDIMISTACRRRDQSESRKAWLGGLILTALPLGHFMGIKTHDGVAGKEKASCSRAALRT